MKFVNGLWHDQMNVRSLPVRGAWIEMGIPRDIIRAGRSLPVRGAWIEIVRAGMR